MSPQVAGYYRVSKARDGMQGPAIYEDEIRRYCIYKQLELARIYSDLDYSGYRGAKQRPGLDELTADCKQYSAVIVPKLSRFGRSVSDLTGLFDLFEKQGVAVVFLDLNVDMTTSQGRLLRNIMAAFAEFESDVKGDYSRANHLHRARQGKPGGGNPPIGYLRRDKALVIDPGKAPLVREIFGRYVSGESQISIAARLNGSGTLGPAGKPWHQGSIRRVLDNPTYAAKRRVDDGLVDAQWEPLIDDATWGQVRTLSGQRTNRYAVGGRVRYLLSGLLTCSTCGGKLTHRNGPHGSSLYVCRVVSGRPRCKGGHTAQERADRIVTEAFFERFSAIEVRTGKGAPARGGSREVWETLSLVQRRDLLKLVLDRLVLLPRKAHEPTNTPRDIEIVWTDRWLIRDREQPLAAYAIPFRELPLKTCIKCCRQLAPEAFWRSPRGDGRDARCAECRRGDRRLADSGFEPGESPPANSPQLTVRQSWTDWRKERLLPR